MAEGESILQLGIEAAREGKREEARSLFRLLTRQEPTNAQAWLWLAGVAENRDERQSALEHVLEIEPENEMAMKSLQALGVSFDEPRVAAPVAPPPPEPVMMPPPPPPSATNPYSDFDEDPFAALDSLSEVMNNEPPPPRRSEPAPSVYTISDDTGGAADAPPPPSRSEPKPSSSSARGPRPSSSAREPKPSSSAREPKPSSSPLAGLFAPRGRSGAAGGSGGGKGPGKQNPLLFPLAGLLLILVIVGIAYMVISSDQSPPRVANVPPKAPQPANKTTIAATEQVTLAPTTSTVQGSVPITNTAPTQPYPEPGQPPAPTVPPAPPVATIAPPAPAPSDLLLAKPAVLSANTPQESNGWLYDFNQPTYATPLYTDLGGNAPQGRFVMVLAFAVNRTGADQPLPANFFVLKDAQGRVYESHPDFSRYYVISGVNADLSQLDPFPADGITRSVAIIFDVAPDATDLVFFARSKPDAGWLVLRGV